MAHIVGSHHSRLIQQLERLQTPQVPAPAAQSSLFTDTIRTIGRVAPSPQVVHNHNYGLVQSSTTIVGGNGIEISSNTPESKKSKEEKSSSNIALLTAIATIAAGVLFGFFGSRVKKEKEILDQLQFPLKHETDDNCALCNPAMGSGFGSFGQLHQALKFIHLAQQEIYNEQWTYSWASATLLVSSAGGFVGSMYLIPTLATACAVAAVASLVLMSITYASHWNDLTLSSREIQENVKQALTILKHEAPPLPPPSYNESKQDPTISVAPPQPPHVEPSAPPQSSVQPAAEAAQNPERNRDVDSKSDED
jgi:hypothetical protein